MPMGDAKNTVSIVDPMVVFISPLAQRQTIRCTGMKQHESSNSLNVDVTVVDCPKLLFKMCGCFHST